jgi:Cof subfamily protein (haloacid dehalogenase superfamily)
MTMERAARPFDLVVMDLDGTLIDQNRAEVPSAEVVDAVAAVQARGIPVTVATGRILHYVRDFVRPMRLAGPGVTTQGAVIGDVQTGQILEEYPLPDDDARAIAEWADQSHRAGALYFNDDGGYTHICQNFELGDKELFDHVIGRHREIVGPLTHMLHGPFSRAPVKFMLISNADQEPCIVEQLQARFGARLTVTRTHPWLVEMTQRGVDKGSGLRRLCHILAIEPQRVFAIGDNDNDIPLLQAAGFGVGMENGTPGLKAVADWVAPPVGEEGAAAALRKWVLGEDAV